MLAAVTGTMFYTNKQVFIKGVQWVNNRDGQIVHQENKIFPSMVAKLLQPSCVAGSFKIA